MFDQAGDALIPSQEAVSSWGQRSTVRGLAVSGVLARAAERTLATAGVTGYRPARWTVDLSRPTRMGECEPRAVVLRTGRRIALVDAELAQEGGVTARARGVFLKAATSAREGVWNSDLSADLPPAGLTPTSRERRLYWSSGTGWTSAAADHNNAERKQLWVEPLTLVAGEETTPFQLAAAYSDLASVVTNWGDGGLRHVNADISLHLARLPSRLEAGLGIAALHHIGADGLTAGTAVMRDCEGTFGLVSVTGLENQAQVVDPGRRD